MSTTIAAITHPIALCAYVISVVFGLLAKKWNSKSNKPGDRYLFYLAAFLSVATVAGGLLLAWHQLPKPAPLIPSNPVVQNSSGDQSPNVNSSGSGSVSVQIGSAPPQASAKPAEKKK
jgi:hypothetical protein